MLNLGRIQKMEYLWKMPIFFTRGSGEAPMSTGHFMTEGEILLCAPQLVEDLLQRQNAQAHPVVTSDRGKFCFFCMFSGEYYYLSGPFCLESPTAEEVHRFYRSWHISTDDERPPRLIAPYEALNFISLLYELLTGKDVLPAEIAASNHLTDILQKRMGGEELERANFELRQIIEGRTHHTYRDERFVLNCVREGQPDKIRDRFQQMIDEAGVMSADPIMNMRYICVISVTLAAREAIAAGIPPADVYQSSDYILNHLENFTQYDELFEFSLQAMISFAEMCRGQGNDDSSYTELVKSYVARNYQQKIYIRDIADKIGISQGHLSRVFHEDTGMKIQDYILKYRIDRASFLLQYSDMSIAEVGFSVGFQTQSNFGSLFKKQTGMTPGDFRLRGSSGAHSGLHAEAAAGSS